MDKLSIDVWSDIACPWCWVGKRHLEQALESFEHPVELTWRSFELNPTAPKSLPDDVDYVERLGRKYGVGRDGAQSMIDRMVQTGEQRGLEFRFDHAKPGNTFDAHRLVHLAKKSGLQDAMKERCFAAYMTEGKLISDHGVLADLADEVGLDADEVAQVLGSESFAKEVRADEARAHEIGVSGVPFFVMGERYAVGGAQPAAQITEVLQRAWNERKQPTPAEQAAAEAEAEACGPDGCEVPAP